MIIKKHELTILMKVDYLKVTLTKAKTLANINEKAFKE